MELLKLETNVPESIALKYSDGKDVDGQYGPQVFFSLVDGRGFYAPPIVADKIAKLGIRAGQPFELCKAEVKNGAKKSIEYRITPVEAMPQAKLQTSPAVATQQSPANVAVQQPQINTSAAIGLTAVSNLESAGMEAVEVIGRVEAKAKQTLGDNFEFSSEDVRAIWLSLFIGVDRAVGASSWRR